MLGTTWKEFGFTTIAAPTAGQQSGLMTQMAIVSCASPCMDDRIAIPEPLAHQTSMRHYKTSRSNWSESPLCPLSGLPGGNEGEDNAATVELMA
jgi:hypothetical protein